LLAESQNQLFWYWIPTESYFELMYATNNSILKSLKDANVEFAYPKQIVQVNSSGK